MATALCRPQYSHSVVMRCPDWTMSTTTLSYLDCLSLQYQFFNTFRTLQHNWCSAFVHTSDTNTSHRQALKDLHWLPVDFRIEYNVCLLMTWYTPTGTHHSTHVMRAIGMLLNKRPLTYLLVAWLSGRTSFFGRRTSLSCARPVADG